MILNDGELGVLGSNYKYLGNFLFGWGEDSGNP
jgi:hypothetical protein